MGIYEVVAYLFYLGKAAAIVSAKSGYGKMSLFHAS